MRRGWRAKLGARLGVIALSLSGCGGGGNTLTTPPPQITVTVTPATANVAAGGPLQFTATVTGSSNATIVWEVNGTAGGSAAVGTISASGAYTAANAAGNSVISAVVQSGSTTASGHANVSTLAPHQFGVRATSTLPEFYVRSSGNALVPRGNQYVRLASLTQPDGSLLLAHSTFSVGIYDSAHAESALSAMAASGYNIVTVTLEGCCQNKYADGQLLRYHAVACSHDNFTAIR